MSFHSSNISSQHFKPEPAPRHEYGISCLVEFRQHLSRRNFNPIWLRRWLRRFAPAPNHTISFVDTKLVSMSKWESTLDLARVCQSGASPKYCHWTTSYVNFQCSAGVWSAWKLHRVAHNDGRWQLAASLSLPEQVEEVHLCIRTSQIRVLRRAKQITYVENGIAWQCFLLCLGLPKNDVKNNITFFWRMVLEKNWAVCWHCKNHTCFSSNSRWHVFEIFLKDTATVSLSNWSRGWNGLCCPALNISCSTPSMAVMQLCRTSTQSIWRRSSFSNGLGWNSTVSPGSKQSSQPVHSISLQRIHFARAVPGKLEISSMHRVPAPGWQDKIPKQIVHVDLVYRVSIHDVELVAEDTVRGDPKPEVAVVHHYRLPYGVSTRAGYTDFNFVDVNATVQDTSLVADVSMGRSSDPTTLRTQGTRRSSTIFGEKGCFAHFSPCFFDVSQYLDLLRASVMLERFATGSSAPWTAAGTTGASTAHVATAVAEVLRWRGCEQSDSNRISIERCSVLSGPWNPSFQGCELFDLSVSCVEFLPYSPQPSCSFLPYAWLGRLGGVSSVNFCRCLHFTSFISIDGVWLLV